MSKQDIDKIKMLNRLKLIYTNLINNNPNFFITESNSIEKLLNEKNNLLSELLLNSNIFLFNDEKKNIKNIIQRDILKNLQILDLLKDESIIF
tara:strand:+ start:781 stop:1059 length:279 start_codon:yes stop_codon:yes gene_type:complete